MQQTIAPIEHAVQQFLDRKSYSRESFESEIALAEQITITAPAGAGKTSLLNGLQAKLPTHMFVSAGRDIMRPKAKELGISIEEFAKLCENPECNYDRECDGQLHRASIAHPRLVVESRLAHCAIPNGYHVKLACSLGLRTSRRFIDLRAKASDIVYSEVFNDLRNRDCGDAARLTSLYPGCLWEEEDYDLVISTERSSPQKVVEYVLRGYAEWRAYSIEQRLAHWQEQRSRREIVVA